MTARKHEMRALAVVIAIASPAAADPRVLHRCAQVQQLAGDADAVYGVAAHHVVRIPRDGGDMVRIADTGTALDLAVDGVFVDWLANGELHRVTKIGGNDRVLAKLDDASVLAVDGATIYVRGGSRIIAVRGGAVATVATGIHSRVGAIAVDATWLYWSEADHIARVPKAGGKAETIVVDADPNGSRLLVDADRIYWAEAGKIMAAPTRAPGTPVVLAKGKAEIAAIAQDASHVYWVGQNEVTADDDVLRVAKQGGAIEPVALGELGNSGGPMNELVVDAAGVTVATLDGRVLVYAKRGTAKRPAVKPDRCP